MGAADTKHAARARRAEREQWIDDLLASDLQMKLKVLGVRIARYKNDSTGQCNPSVATLAQGIGQSERTVQRWLKILRAQGWIDYTDNRGGLRKSTQFTLTKPRHKCVTVSTAPKGDSPATKPRQNEPERVTHLRHPNLRTKENLRTKDPAVARAPLADGERAHPPTFGKWSNVTSEQPVIDEAQKQVDKQVSEGLSELAARLRRNST
jgi:hypothetical protein